jgi:hypothetical protein
VIEDTAGLQSLIENRQSTTSQQSKIENHQ